MPGYLSSLIVLFSSVLLLSGASLLSSARSTDLSHAIAVERAYGHLMNAKECALEAARQGAFAGFSAYDASHELYKCRHCPDHLCVIPTPANPLPPNACEEALCSGCFREPEARAAADGAALAALYLMHGDDPRDGFELSYGPFPPGGLESFLAPDSSSKNGYRVGSVRFRNELPVSVRSAGLGVSLDGRVPDGTVVGYGPAYD